jgi:hypothetical protein
MNYDRLRPREFAKVTAGGWLLLMTALVAAADLALLFLSVLGAWSASP